MIWADYLEALDRGIEVLASRAADQTTPETTVARPVVFDPRRPNSAPNECLIGVGSHWHGGQDDPRPVEHSGICLNDKGLTLPGQPGRGFQCVTELALDPPHAVLDHWLRVVGEDAAPVRFFARFTLVVEDASPDSCLGLIVLLARLNGVDRSEVPEQWVRYARQWEHGASRVADPFRAWGPLLTALSHGYWDMDAFRSDATGDTGAASRHALAASLTRAWVAGLRFTIALLRAGSPPEPIAEAALCAEAERAHAFLNYEHQAYLQTLQQAETLQLLLPMEGGTGRRKIVDACLLEETTATGAQKIFLRNDREQTWLGDGFGLMGVYRPGLAGSGDDMTLSVDPATGVHLQELWQCLEALEDQAWKGERPCGNPREVAGYPGGRRPDSGASSPDQPWWDDRGTYTLLAAPRYVYDGRLGSRLSWRKDVLEALWECYRPVRFLSMVDHTGVLRPLLDCRSEPIDDTGKGWLLLRWPRADMILPVEPSSATPRSLQDALSALQPVLLTPTLQRCLAACVADQDGSTGDRHALASLPTTESFDFIQVAGGYVLAHADGVAVLDDWRSTPLCEVGIRAAVDRVADRLRLLRSQGKQAGDLLGLLGQRIKNGRFLGFGGGAVLDRLAEIRVCLRQGLHATEPAMDDPRLAEIHLCLERRWGIASELQRIDRTIDAMEQTLRSYAELRSNRLINFLTVIGFPLALFAGFFQFAVADMPRDWSGLSAWFHGDDVAGPHWPAMALFLGLSLVAMVLIWLSAPLMRRLGRLRLGGSLPKRTGNAEAQAGRLIGRASSSAPPNDTPRA